MTERLVMPDELGTRDDFLAEWRSSMWEAGARYWRGEVAYRPTWSIVDLELHRLSIRRPAGEPMLYARLIVVSRIDDNSASQPPGTRDWLAPCCFQQWEEFSGGALMRQLVGVRAVTR